MLKLFHLDSQHSLWDIFYLINNKNESQKYTYLGDLIEYQRLS